MLRTTKQRHDSGTREMDIPGGQRMLWKDNGRKKGMNVLCVADEEDKSLWDYYTPDKLRGLDLIISCGDLDSDYLQFLVTMASCPLLYIHGNHDGSYVRKPPFGCTCIEDEVYNFRGLRILGLGGSMRYKEGPNMYTEAQMKRRIARLQASLMMTAGFDVLVTHAPAKGWGDLEDLPHQGFECFNSLMDRYHPKYMLHGHVHKSYGHFERMHEHSSGTHIINTCGAYRMEIGPEEHPARGKTGSPLYDRYIRMRAEMS